MTDEKDQDNEINEKQSESKQRRFDLKLIFVIIIGLSCVFAILIFRNVKKVIQNPPEYKMDRKEQGTLKRRKGMSAQERAEHFEKHKNKIAQAARQEKLAPKGRLLIAKPQNKFPSREIPVYINPQNLELIPLKKGLRSRVQEVSNIIAVNKSFVEQFDSSDILDEKMGRIFVRKEKAQELEGERVSYNLRTKQLGVITGKLFLKFSSAENFEKRREIYPESLREQRVFEATQLAILESNGQYSLNELLSLEFSLSQRPELQRVRVEILEHGKTTK